VRDPSDHHVADLALVDETQELRVSTPAKCSVWATRPTATGRIMPSTCDIDAGGSTNQRGSDDVGHGRLLRLGDRGWIIAADASSTGVHQSTRECDSDGTAAAH
jgi:hypothetical protein